MKTIRCEGPGCHFTSTDRREFWHFQPPGIDLCLKCSDVFNHEKNKVASEVEALKTAMLTKFYTKFLSGQELEIEIEESDKEEVI